MTHLWIPKIKIAESRGIVTEHPLRPRVEGRFSIVGSLPDGRTRHLASFSNLLLTAGLNRLPSNGVADYCVVGSGSTTPAVTDTALVSFLRASALYSSATDGFVTTSPRYQYARSVYVFAAPGSNLNLNEIGIGWLTNGSGLWSRSLIKDGGGNPITLSWLSAETLTVTYELRLYVPESDVAYEETIGGTTYTGTLRASNAIDINWAPGIGNPKFSDKSRLTLSGASLLLYTGASSAIDVLTGQPSGSSVAGGSEVNNAYVSNSFALTGSRTFGPSVVGTGKAWKWTTPLGTFQKSINSPYLSKALNYTLVVNVSTPVWGS